MLAVPTEVSDRDLKSSFDRLDRAVVKPDGAPRYLLRYYAVECGLKSAILRRRRLRSTEQLDPDLRSHDLTKLAKELRLAPDAYADTRPCRRPSAVDGRAVVPASAVHEAWRYGARLDERDEARFVNGLAVLSRWCREELGL
jgi:hypothetical protein